MPHEHDHWKKGPLPADTWMWGGVVPVGEESGGFYFADFKGDTVEIVGCGEPRTLKADEVAYYANCLTLPPCCPKSATRMK